MIEKPNGQWPSNSLPDPLVPPEVNLRDFPYMPLECGRLRRSKQWLVAKRRPEIGFYSINLWTAAWHEVPAGSIEDDDDVLADAAMCAPEKWDAVKAEVMRGWVKCSDGRLYHPVVCEKAAEAFECKKRQRARTAAVLGKAHVWFVDWPEGCKDANDMLLSDGREALCELVTNGALEWPVRGLYRLSQLPEVAAVTTWDPGFPEWGNRVKLAPRMLSVVTGFPGHGKSQFFTQLWFQIVRHYDLKIMVASFETAPKPHMRRQLRTLISGALERNMSDTQRFEADRWINAHYLFALDGIGDDTEVPTFDWLLEKAEYAVIRYGVKIIQLDPWNRLESGQNHGETTTAYIGRCLRALHNFARQMGVHVQVIGHPAKQLRADRKDPPDIDDMSDSQHWRNMPDQGFVIHRPKIFEDGQRQTEAVLYHKKARFEELGYEANWVSITASRKAAMSRPITKVWRA